MVKVLKKISLPGNSTIHVESSDLTNPQTRKDLKQFFPPENISKQKTIYFEHNTNKSSDFFKQLFWMNTKIRVRKINLVVFCCWDGLTVSFTSIITMFSLMGKVGCCWCCWRAGEDLTFIFFSGFSTFTWTVMCTLPFLKKINEDDDEWCRL